MYIPKEVLTFILGFIFFPILASFIIKLKGWDKNGRNN